MTFLYYHTWSKCTWLRLDLLRNTAEVSFDGGRSFKGMSLQSQPRNGDILWRCDGKTYRTGTQPPGGSSSRKRTPDMYLNKSPLYYSAGGVGRARA